MSLSIDLKLFTEGIERDNFGWLLFRLIAKADRFNLEKLRRGFPEAVALWEVYQMTGEVVIKEEEEMTDKIGPTGDFPQGRLNEVDEGGLKIAVYIENGKIVINFGKSVNWIGMDKLAALRLINSLISKVTDLP